MQSLLFDLAQLIEAGIAPVEAIRRLQSDRVNDDHSLTRLAEHLQRGRGFASALGEAGYASKLETEILSAAEGAGKLSEGLRFVATNLEQRRARTKTLRLRLWLPNFVLFIALAIQVVRTTTTDTALSAALVSAGIIALLAVGTSQLLLIYAARDPSHWLALGWRLKFHNSSDLFRHLFEQTFYTLFVWQIDSGLDYTSGSKALASLVDCASYRQAVTRYRQHVREGGAVADALTRAGLLAPGELEQVILVGEQSGRLGPALRHYLTFQGEHLERVLNNIYTWLPRLYYIIVLAIGIWFVI